MGISLDPYWRYALYWTGELTAVTNKTRSLG
jgi:hypothetical protein